MLCYETPISVHVCQSIQKRRFDKCKEVNVDSYEFDDIHSKHD